MRCKVQIIKRLEEQNIPTLLKALLFLMSKVFSFVVRGRNFFYRHLYSPKKAPLFVLSVGNIVAGGCGKTPVVHYLAQALQDEKVAILSRGYKRKGKKTLLVDEGLHWQEVGDEPYMLAKKLPKAKVIVGADRYTSALLAKDLQAGVAILDDGMQHRKLHRDVEIVVMQALDLFGKGFFLPLGFLRDSVQSLARADLIVVNGVLDERHYQQVCQKILPYSKAPITAFSIEVKNKEIFLNKKVAVFCSIAASYRFINTLKSLQCQIVYRKEKADHHPFSKKELESFERQALQLGAEIFVCTEKDLVKVPKDFFFTLPLKSVEITLSPTFGAHDLERLIQKVKDEQRV